MDGLRLSRQSKTTIRLSFPRQYEDHGILEYREDDPDIRLYYTAIATVTRPQSLTQKTASIYLAPATERINSYIARIGHPIPWLPEPFIVKEIHLKFGNPGVYNGSYWECLAQKGRVKKESKGG